MTTHHPEDFSLTVSGREAGEIPDRADHRLEPLLLRHVGRASSGRFQETEINFEVMSVVSE